MRSTLRPRRLRRLGLLSLAAALSCVAAVATAAPFRDPPDTFTQWHSNTAPLVVGMTIDDAWHALASPLHHVSGRAGNATLLAIRRHGGGGFFDRRDRLYLQFRNGRLTGWKGDWGMNWIWQ